MKTAGKSSAARADAKLQNLPPAALDELWALRHPEVEGDRAWTLTDVAAWVPGRFGFDVAVSAVGNFYQWLELKRRMDGAAARSEQAKLEWVRENPGATPDDLEKLGQMVFTSEAIQDGNVKAFVALLRERTRAKIVEHDRRRLELLETAAADAKAKLLAVTTAAKSQGGISAETLARIEEAAGLL
jgi:hypothetical protein